VLRFHVQPIAEAVTNGDVRVIAAEIDQRVAGADIEVDVGVRLEERAEARQQPSCGERRRHADAKLPRVAALSGLAHGIGDLGERQADASGQTLALLGDANPPARALDEAHAERCLERFDLVTDRAVRDAQRLRGLREAPGTRGRLERAQRLHRGNPQGHREAGTPAASPSCEWN
jgi:hypothetical protein